MGPEVEHIVEIHVREDAERFLAEIRQRFRQFNLELHPTKTRLMEFGRYATQNRQRRGEGKPESFDFLGFTHSCDKTRNGKFIVLRQTMRKRMQAKLREIKLELRRRMHHSTPEVGQWLRSVSGWALSLLCGAPQSAEAQRFQVSGVLLVVPNATAAEPTSPDHR